jgi:UPF0755 protein
MRNNKASSSFPFTLVRWIIYLVIIFAIIMLGKSAYNYGYAVFADRKMSEAPGVAVTVTIKPGMSTYKIGKLLQRKGLVKDAKVFVVQEKLSNYRGKIKPGSYIVNTSFDINKILAILAQEQVEEQSEDGGQSNTSATQTNGEN